MTDSLNIAQVVDTLVDLDLVDFYGSGPWPGEPEDADVYEPDWTQVLPNSPDVEVTQIDMPVDPWAGACDEIWSRSEAGFLVPPDDVIDALAWYTPMHFYGLGSAIYIREAAVFDFAAAILNRLEPYQQEDEVNVAATSRAAMSVLYLHEAFHHKIESLAIRYEIVERARRYVPYFDDVVTPLLRVGSEDVLEEALATAEMYRRFKNEKVYRRGLPAIVAKATIEMLVDWFPTLPPSYKRASQYLGDETFQDGLQLLMSQIHEATTTPSRRSGEWALAPHMHRGLFDCQRITHVVVPQGERPRLPWIGRTPALVSMSTRKAVKGLEKRGWRTVRDRGSGSHIWMEREGWPSVTLKANQESLSPVVLKNIAHALGVRLADLRF